MGDAPVTPALVIGSRGSQLALWQARWIQARLVEQGVESRIEIIKTTGDKITDVPLAKVGGKGLFTKEIEEALLDGRIDLAVHSLKDLPTELPSGLTIAAIPRREEPFDALIGHKLADLPQGAKVGTSSLRRAAQLRVVRPDLRIESIRGNLDTRLRKLDEGDFDAILLAAAGLRRLGWKDRIAETLAPDVMCPAVGQGALAVETRDDRGFAWQACGRLDDPATRAAVTAERAILAGLGGGCQVPIGAHAVLDGTELKVRALVVSPDGTQVVHAEASGPASHASELGDQMAQRLLRDGAQKILDSVYSAGSPLQGQRIVVTRARQQAAGLTARLGALGAEVLELPVIDFAGPAHPGALREATELIDEYDWIIFTSVNGVHYFLDAVGERAIRARICCIGPATADAARDRGLDVDLIPRQYVAEHVVEAFAQFDLNHQKILLPRAAVARDVIPEALRSRGARVDVVEAYRTVVPWDLKANAERIFGTQRPPDWVTVTSSSTVKNLLAAVGREALMGIRIASIGPVTSEVCRKHGLTVAVEASPYTMDGLVQAICSAPRQAT